MKSYNRLFEKATSDEAIESALMQASRGKRTRQAIKRVLDKKEKYIKRFKDWLIRGEYKPAVHKAVYINDGFSRKKRIIIQPYFYPELWVQSLLKSDLIVHCNNVEKLVKVKLNQNQFDSLVSFEYNTGYGNFSSSTLLKLLNKGDYTGAAGQFERWVYAGGKVLAGLQKRRKAEKELFLKTD